MNIAVSSIAWANEEEELIANKLNELGIKCVELAPTKIWDDPTKISFEEARKVVDWWKDYDIEVVAFQSMLFSRPDLKLFKDKGNRQEMLSYLKDFIKIAGMMGVKKMVFGSPKNRQRNDMPIELADKIAHDFFYEIGETAIKHGVVFCLEPNAEQYNCDYVTNVADGAKLVRKVNSKGFGLHLDTGCMTLAGDDITQSILKNKDILEHFHISSPMLEQVDKYSKVDNDIAVKALHDIKYDKIISIEMRPGDVGTNVDRLEKAVRFVQKVYF